MSKEKEITSEQEREEYNKMVNGNTILFSLEGWIKYIEGFIKGLNTTDKVSSDAVLDCVGEILEYMTSFRSQLLTLLMHCEDILQTNEELTEQIKQLSTPKLTSKGDKNGNNKNM